MPTFTLCRDCGSEHMGGPCGLTFRQRLLSTRVDPTALETRTLRNYYDPESLPWDGDEAYATMMDNTDGIGYAKTGTDGEVYHRNRNTGEVEALDNRSLDVLLGSRTERDPDDSDL